MNHNEAKEILRLYRQGTADAEDPQIAEALALAKSDPELAKWLEAHCARQFVITEKLRQITVPAGLREQIISEQAAQKKSISRRPRFALAAAAVILLLGAVAFFFFPKPGSDDLLAVYQNQMVGVALRGYGMDLTTNDLAQIRVYLAQNHAPSDFILPPALKHAALAGCAVEGWQNTKVSMLCFRTGKSVAAGGQSDLWLFVVDSASVKAAPGKIPPQFSKVNRLLTATWTQGGKLYVLGTEGDEAAIKQYL